MARRSVVERGIASGLPADINAGDSLVPTSFLVNELDNNELFTLS